MSETRGHSERIHAEIERLSKELRQRLDEHEGSVSRSRAAARSSRSTRIGSAPSAVVKRIVEDRLAQFEGRRARGNEAVAPRAPALMPRRPSPRPPHPRPPSQRIGDGGMTETDLGAAMHPKRGHRLCPRLCPQREWLLTFRRGKLSPSPQACSDPYAHVDRAGRCRGRPAACACGAGRHEASSSGRATARRRSSWPRRTRRPRRQESKARYPSLSFQCSDAAVMAGGGWTAAQLAPIGISRIGERNVSGGLLTDFGPPPPRA